MQLYKDIKFLIVDDEEQFRIHNSERLVELGFDKESLVTANNGVEALIELQKKKYEFLIVDLVMPEMNGLELIKAVRAIDLYKKVPILIVSSTIDRTIVLSTVEAGANGFIAKPLEKKVLAEKLVTIANRSSFQ